jgi:hypothetical protein
MPNQKQSHGRLRKVPKNNFAAFSPQTALDVPNPCTPVQGCVRQFGPDRSTTPKKRGRPMTPFGIEAELDSLTHPKNPLATQKRFLDALGCWCRRRFDYPYPYISNRTSGPRTRIAALNSLLFWWCRFPAHPVNSTSTAKDRVMRHYISHRRITRKVESKV